MEPLINCEKKSVGVTEKTVIFGNPTDLSVDKISNIIPFGKVLLVASTKTFLARGNEIIKKLKEKGNKVISIVTESETIISTDGVCGFFNASEEVRAVIALDVNLFSAALYFGTVKNIPCFLLSYGFPLNFGLEERIYLKNGNTYDRVAVACDRYVFVDDTVEDENSRWNLCAYLAEKACALVDYYVYSKAQAQALDNRYVSAVLSVVFYASFFYDSKKANSKRRLFNLCVNADRIASCRDNFLSAASVAVELSGGTEAERAENLIKFSKNLLKTYESALSAKNALPIFPDYRARAEKLEKIFGFDETEILSNYLFQARLIRTNGAYGAFDCFSHDLSFLRTAVEIIEKKILGKELDEIGACESPLKFCGDTPLSFNGMSLIRELGVT